MLTGGPWGSSKFEEDAYLMMQQAIKCLFDAWCVVRHSLRRAIPKSTSVATRLRIKSCARASVVGPNSAGPMKTADVMSAKLFGNCAAIHVNGCDPILRS